MTLNELRPRRTADPTNRKRCTRAVQQWFSPEDVSNGWSVGIIQRESCYQQFCRENRSAGRHFATMDRSMNCQASCQENAPIEWVYNFDWQTTRSILLPLWPTYWTFRNLLRPREPTVAVTILEYNFSHVREYRFDLENLG